MYNIAPMAREGAAPKCDGHDKTFCILAAVSVAIMGAVPHVVFSCQAGELTWFKSAYDEDIYAELALNGPWTPQRALSSLLFVGLRWLTGGNTQLTLVFFDVVFPTTCALLAAYVACRIAREQSIRLLLLIGFIFGQELFSFGSTAVWSRSIESIRPMLPDFARSLLPDFSTSFFVLFRTPEPQVSWVVMWAFFAFLVTGWPGHTMRVRAGPTILLLLLNLCFPFCYIFVGIPLILLEFILAVLHWLRGRLMPASLIAGSAAVSSLLTVALNHWSAATKDRLSMIFHSRLPVITPSVVFSVLCFVLLKYFLSQKRGKTELLALACALVAMPVLMMNQHLISGLMISPSNWERYVNYPVLILGLAVGAAAVSESIPFLGSSWWRRARSIVSVFLVILILGGQGRVYRLWHKSNEIALAMGRAANVARRNQNPGTVLVLDSPDLAPLVLSRISPPPETLLSYVDLVRHRIGNMQIDGAVPIGRSEHQDRLLEFMARMGKSPREVASILESEASQHSGYYLAYLFSFRDFWFPASSDRAVRQTWIAAQIPKIVDTYQNELARPPETWKRVAILITQHRLEAVDGTGLWKTDHVTSAIVGSSRVEAYLQRPVADAQKLFQAIQDDNDRR